jgi:putative hydrolase of the HAD superfamily
LIQGSGATGVDGEPGVQAVIFDWGGTLAPWVSMDELAGWRAFAEVLHPGDPELAARVAAALLAAEVGRWGRVRTESRAFRLEQVLADATAALTEAGYPEVPYHDGALAAFREACTVVTHTRPEAAAMLAELRRRGLALGVLSSTGWPGQWHEDFLRRDGVLGLFDACVWSSDLEWTKPHPAAFEAAMHAVGVSDPRACVYVGDRLYDDIFGANRIGMRTVFVPHSVLPPEQVVQVDVRPDAVLDKLSDLPAILADW